MTRYIFILIFFLLSIIACNTKNNNLSIYECKSHDCKWVNDTFVNSAFPYTEYTLIFQNNPFHFDSTNILRFTLSGEKIFIGSYGKYKNVRIANKFVNSYSVPTLEIIKNDKIYKWGDSKGFPQFLGQCPSDTHQLFASKNLINIIFLAEEYPPNNILFLQ
jgi:hypothetical protein